MTEQRSVLEICIPDSVINGFCYSYAKALLEKLKELEKEDRIFKDGLDDAQYKEKSEHIANSSGLTKIAEVILNAISKQINYESLGHCSKPSEIEKVINVTKEFLAIFETKK